MYTETVFQAAKLAALTAKADLGIEDVHRMKEHERELGTGHEADLGLPDFTRYFPQSVLEVCAFRAFCRWQT